MKLIREVNSLLGIELSKAQQAVLAIVAGSSTPKLAQNAISNNINIKVAAKMLGDLGVLKRTPEGLILTDLGNQQLISYNIVDDSGNLTEIGKKLIDEYKVKLDFLNSL
jgi:hypothetical protein